MTANTDPCVNFAWFKGRILIQKALQGGIPKRIRVAVVLFLSLFYLRKRYEPPVSDFLPWSNSFCMLMGAGEYLHTRQFTGILTEMGAK